MTSPIVPPLKRCSKCGEEKPATVEYFHKSKSGKNGVGSWCKTCRSAYKREYRKINKEKIAADAIRYRLENPDKVYGYAAYYRETHREQIREKSREYHRNNREKRIKQCLVYRLKNIEKIAEYNRNYHKQNRHISVAQRQRRRARIGALPDTFTVQDWLRCLEYWHHCCAVCGKQLRDLFGEVKPNADHWISLNNTDCPGTVISNMICLCNKCNLSKSDNDPIEWLNRKFGKRKAKQILDRIHAYFEWAKQQ
jgi:hypothetical protein